MSSLQKSGLTETQDALGRRQRIQQPPLVVLLLPCGGRPSVLDPLCLLLALNTYICKLCPPQVFLNVPKGILTNYKVTDVNEFVKLFYL